MKLGRLNDGHVQVKKGQREMSEINSLQTSS